MDRHSPKGLTIHQQRSKFYITDTTVYEASILAYVPDTSEPELVRTNRGEGYRFRAILLANAKLSNGKYFQTVYTRGWLSSVEVSEAAKDMIVESLASLKSGEYLTGKFLHIGPSGEGEQFFKDYFALDRDDLKFMSDNLSFRVDRVEDTV